LKKIHGQGSNFKLVLKEKKKMGLDWISGFKFRGGLISIFFFIGLAYQGKDILFRFIIEYSS
jgi:hypothetical protein